MRRLLPLLPLAPLLGACTGEQSMFVANGAAAEDVALLGWVMIGGACAIFVVVLLLTVFAAFAPARWRGWLGARAVILGGGVAFPLVVLTALLVWGLGLLGAGTVAPGSTPLRIEVVGEQFWWRVRYLGEDGNPVAVSANEIRIPVGRPVEFVLTTSDVIHSFWIPSLAGKLDMIPGHVNRLVLTAARPGTYRGQCAEYCGAQHAKMAFYVVAMEPAEFATWLEAERQPAAEPADPFLAEGKALFASTGCGACHTIRGTEAAGVIGPDLTHVGGRLSIAAGILPNNRGTLAGWIASAQHIKEGSKMPSFDVLPGRQLRAVAAYLESLK